MSVATPPPSAVPGLLAGLLRMQPQPASRLLFSLRAGAGVALPVLVGTLAGQPGSGMVAALGGLTALYGGQQPYRARAVALLCVAATFALAVGLGSAVGHRMPVAVVPLVALMAMAATWVCNALRVGPPGAYLFMLACAGGSAIPTGNLTDSQIMGLVLAGGLGAWCLHMAGALVDRHGPERRAVELAGRQVQALVAATGPERHAARRRASLAVHDAWQALVAWQPRQGGATLLDALRQRNRQWHLLLAAIVAGRLSDAQAAAQAAALQAAPLQYRSDDAIAGQGHSLPWGRPDRATLLLQALRPGTASRAVIVRVGIAALVAGILASLAGLDRAYWAMGAAVLMLHTGSNWPQTVLRATQRLLGTWTGLLLTAAVLWWQPSGLWMVALLFVLQFTIEMLVMRNYALAAIFITATGMTLASGGQPLADPHAFLLARGLDTLLGCGVALGVLRLLPVQPLPAQVADGIQQTLKAAEVLNSHLAWAELTSPAARRARAVLGQQTHALDAAWEQARRQDEGSAGASWTVVLAVQEVAYRLLATAWQLEQAPDAAQQARALYGREGVSAMQAALRQLARAAASGQRPAPLPSLPVFAAAEMQALARALTAPAPCPPGTAAH